MFKTRNHFSVTLIAIALISGIFVVPTQTTQAVALSNCSLSPLVNGNFEVPNDVTNIGAFRDDASLETYAGIGWRTTEPTKKIEFWPGASNPVDTGSQFIELNGDDFAGVYQDFVTAPGATLTWSLLHKNRDGFEQMAVRIGPATGPVALPLASNSLLIRQGSLIGNSTSTWATRSGSYVVPAGQTVTRFYLESVSVVDFVLAEFANREVFNNEGIISSIGNHVDNVTLTASTCEPAYIEPTPVPYLKSITSPKMNLKDGKLVCSVGTYKAGYEINGIPQGDQTKFYVPANFLYNLHINGVAQTSLSVTSSTASASWNLSAAPAASLASCSVTVTVNSLTNTDKSTDNTAAIGSALSTQTTAATAADATYAAALSANAKAYQKALVDNRANWRTEIAAIRTNYFDTVARINAQPKSAATNKKMIADKSTALKVMTAAQKKSAADYKASQPAAAAARDAANKAALDAKTAAIAKANATYGTFIESIGYGVLIP